MNVIIWLNPPADKVLIPRPLGDKNIPVDTPLLAAGQLIFFQILWERLSSRDAILVQDSFYRGSEAAPTTMEHDIAEDKGILREK